MNYLKKKKKLNFIFLHTNEKEILHEGVAPYPYRSKIDSLLS